MKQLFAILLFCATAMTSFGQASSKDFKLLAALSQPWICYSNSDEFSQEEWEQIDDVTIEGHSFRVSDEEQHQNSIMTIHFAPQSGKMALVFTPLDHNETELPSQTLILSSLNKKIFTFENQESHPDYKSLSDGQNVLILQSFDCSKKDEIIARKQYVSNKGLQTVVYAFKKES